MRIERVRIQAFRKLVEPVVIDGLELGLNVIAGDNEEGKSTVLEALLAVFFNRHRLTGREADDMQPFGHRGRPEIEVRFELDGQAYRLYKAFCQRPEAVLESANGRHQGDAAEEALQEMLRFTPPGRGAARIENRGLLGLFWVEQGSSFHRPEVAGPARGTLMAALEHEVGDVLGGERGRRLLRVFEERLRQFYTGTGRPRGRLADAENAIEQARATEADLAARLAEYEEKVDQLGRMRATLQAYRDERRLETARASLKKAEEASAGLERLRDQVKDAERDRELALAQLQRQEERRRARRTLVDELQEAEKARERHGAQEAELAELLAAVEGRAEAARAGFVEASRAREAAEKELGRAELLERALRLKAEIEALDQRLARARAAKDKADQARARAAAVLVDDEALARIRRLERDRADAEAALASASTRLDLEPLGGRGAHIGGEPVAGRLHLSEPARLELENWGTIAVTPGGDDLDLRRERARAAREALANALRALGVESPATAEARNDERRRLLADALIEARLAEEHAPEGVEALATKRLDKAAELEALALPAGEVETPDGARALVEAARARLEAARRLENERRADADAAADEARVRREELVKARTTREVGEGQVATLRAKLDAERAGLPDGKLEEQARGAAEALGEAESRLGALGAALEALNPEAVELEQDRARRALEAVAGEMDRLARDSDGLARELHGMGGAGLGEQLEEARAARIDAGAEEARVRRDAEAVRLLYETLSDAEREAKDRFLEPVRRRLTPYLRLLFPEVELVFDQDGLVPTHLRRDGRDEPFAQLSVGTREQLAVLTRLAFAELLAEHGQPALVILDDSLVFADAERFQRMLLALRRAESRGLQVLLLTCRERDYQDLGARLIRLRDCRVPA